MYDRILCQRFRAPGYMHSLVSKVVVSGTTTLLILVDDASRFLRIEGLSVIYPSFGLFEVVPLSYTAGSLAQFNWSSIACTCVLAVGIINLFSSWDLELI